MNTKLSFIFIAIFSIGYAQNETPPTAIDSIQQLDEVILSTNVIFGNKFVAKNRTGSSYFISPQELKKFGYTDINRILRNVPGVNIYEEDGFGLRPNISLRGTSPERSSKITLMEDGVLIAPAPYSAPAAYYFPTIARMEAVEILKGSSQVQYGPFTTGGAINMVSTQIPEMFSANLSASYGSFNGNKFHAAIGTSKQNFGVLVEFLNFSSDGFKNLPNNANTGFDKNDIVAKFRINSNPKPKLSQSVEFKFQYSDEIANETYLGLTDSDFETNPFNRYAASQKDNMKADHVQFTATHVLNITKDFRITTTGYYNNFSRNWYKLNDVVVNDTKVGINSIITNTSAYSDYFDVINGTTNSDANSLLVKANNRNYISKGVQTKFDYHWYGKNAFHDIEIGLRMHYDEEDRFQWIDGYNMNNGIMNLTNKATPGTDANRISSANAFSAFVMYKFKYNKLTLTPGLRYENIDLTRKDYGKNDVNRTGSNLLLRNNKVNVFIPGIGMNYKVNNDISAFTSIHKGFSPPSNLEGQKAEESVNLELGTRFTTKGIRGEVIAFYNQYSNLLGSDLAATGGTGSLEQFNAGEVNVNGFEMLLNYNLIKTNAKYKLPITFSYTYTNSKFLNSFDSDDSLWGEVNIGDQLPYIAKHQFNTTLSLEHKDFEFSLSGRFNGAFRTKAGSGTIPENEKVASNFIIDLSGRYIVNKHTVLTLNLVNLLNSTYAVSRVPTGLRPGLPFGVFAGFELKL
ncbi:MAG: TonB-dependent receptor [Flavobacteriaceae bacterium]|nr:TonB-dependent receptor [Flavobacteriaceae bacterium]